jgi:hypothetical protein
MLDAEAAIAEIDKILTRAIDAIATLPDSEVKTRLSWQLLEICNEQAKIIRTKLQGRSA